MISKKELLKEMNISYGQLYRWKREGLIPDEWFIKQAVSTGQETYFKRDLIIPRIKKILELKEEKSIEELKQFFSPTNDDKIFSIRDLVLIKEIDPIILKYFSKQKEEFNLMEVVMICFFSMNEKDIDYTKYIDVDFSKIKENDLFCYITNDDKLLICKQMEYINKEIKFKTIVNLDDIKKMINKEI